MEEIHSAPLLNGIRGQASCDKKALRKLLSLCSELVEAYPDIMEMDLNPVIVYENGVNIVDARIILKDNFDPEEALPNGDPNLSQ